MPDLGSYIRPRGLMFHLSPKRLTPPLTEGTKQVLRLAGYDADRLGAVDASHWRNRNASGATPGA